MEHSRGGPVRVWTIAALLAGVTLAALVAGWIGFGRVLGALERIGWRGLGALVVWSFLSFTLLGGAWFILLPGRRAQDLGLFVAARMVRDSVGELLPFTQLGGFAAGARAAHLQGLDSRTALAATIVDVTTELIAQLGFTALGLTLLLSRLGGEHAPRPVAIAGLAGLAITAAAAAAFVAFQRRGGPIMARLVARFAPTAAPSAVGLADAVNALYRSPWRLAAAICGHFAAWIASGAGVWLALMIAGAPIGLAQALAIESLVYAVRSVAFVAPMAAGVQEGTYALIGPLFGLPAELALAISLIKRARDLTIGLPVLAIWQGVEARRLLRG